MLIKCYATMVRFFLFFFSMPTVCVAVCDCADHSVWSVLCLLCCATLPTVLTLVYCTHSGPLCSFCAVLNMSVFYVCVCLCVGPEVVAGKGQRPVETHDGGMVMYGNSW